MTAFFTAAKMYTLMLKDPFNEQTYTQKVNILCTSVQYHVATVTFKNGKHSTATILIMQMWITNENNRLYLKINRYTGENNRENFKDCRIE